MLARREKLERLDSKSQTLPELRQWLAGIGEPEYRGGQVYDWLHRRGAREFMEMSNLPMALRAKLQENAYINSIKIKKKLVSGVDGTVKYLYELEDGNCIETVLMRYRHANSLCISTQVGCRMGCTFCASTLGGLVRNLTPAEMLDQIYAAQADEGLRVGSLVLMGIGEPLDNFDNVLRFLRILSSPEGINLSLRHVSLSTCGLADRIRELARCKLGLTLSVSLHAPTDALRSRTMPVNKKWPLAELIDACREYFALTGRRISFEYALIDGVNDSPEHAARLAALLAGLPCHVNLIPMNEVRETGYRRSTGERIQSFRRRLEKGGVTVTVRRELGGDISAACGQLRRESAGT